MEHIGSNPTMISHAVHTQAKNGNLGNNWYSQATGLSIEGSWHTYGVEWLECYQYGRDVLRFYIDDQVTATIMEPTDTRDIEQYHSSTSQTIPTSSMLFSISLWAALWVVVSTTTFSLLRY